MKHLSLTATLIIGLILGHWWPQSELRMAKKEIAELKAKLAKKEKHNTPILNDVTKMMGMTSNWKQDTSRKSAPKPHFTPAMSDPVDDESDSEPTPDPKLDPQNYDNPDDFLNAIRDVWKIRSSAARSALINALNLSPDEADDFDDIIDRLNSSLESKMQEIADEAAESDMAPTETGLVIINRFSDAVLETYRELDEIFPDDWRTDLPDDVDIVSFIDPLDMKPLMDLPGVMDMENAPN